MTTNIYIDGFNLYYGILKNTPYKWLDLNKLSHLLLPKHEINKIKYFTALVDPTYDPDKLIRQQIYIKAIESYIPQLQVYYGKFKSYPSWAPLAGTGNIKKLVKIIKTEEKGTDVQLAIQLLNDAWLDEYECAVLITNDSDFVAALRLIKRQFSDKKIGLLVPSERVSMDLKLNVDFVKKIRKGVISASQLPDPIQGTSIHKPGVWKKL